MSLLKHIQAVIVGKKAPSVRFRWLELVSNLPQPIASSKIASLDRSLPGWGGDVATQAQPGAWSKKESLISPFLVYCKHTEAAISSKHYTKTTDIVRTSLSVSRFVAGDAGKLEPLWVSSPRLFLVL